MKKPAQSNNLSTSQKNILMYGVYFIFALLFLGFAFASYASLQQSFQNKTTSTGNRLSEHNLVAQQSGGSPNTIAPQTPNTEKGVQQVVNLLRTVMTFNFGKEGASDVGVAPAGNGGGNAGGGGNGGSGNLQAVVNWASQISANLTTACNDTWCQLLTPVSNSNSFSTGVFPASDCGSNGGSAGNKYWCADLVWQSYHLAGFTDVLASPGVPSMHNWWRENPPGYYFIPYDGTSTLDRTTLSRIKPGCAILYGSQSDPVSNRGEHIEIINTISYDGNKNGAITTYAANSSNKTRTDPIASGVVVSAHSYDVMGFGCHN